MILALLALGVLKPPTAVQGAAATFQHRPLVMLVEVDPIDRGSAVPGERISRRVSIQNVADKPVTLRVVDKTCECVDVAFGADLLKPGQVTIMEMVVAAAEAEGRQAQQVTVGAIEVVEQGPALTQKARVGLSYLPAVAFVARPTHASIAAAKGDAAGVRFYVRAIEDRVLEDLRAEAKPDNAWEMPRISLSPDRRSATVELRPKSLDQGTFGTVRIMGKMGALTLIAEVQRRDALRLGAPTRCGEEEFRFDVLNAGSADMRVPVKAELIGGPDKATCVLEPATADRPPALRLNLQRCADPVGFGRVRFTDARGVELAQLPWATPENK